MAFSSRDPREHWLKTHFPKNQVANSGYITGGEVWRFRSLEVGHTPENGGNYSRFKDFSIAESIPLGDRSPAHISVAWRRTYSLHQVATFLLRRDPGGCGEMSSAQPARHAASRSGGNSLSGGMPCGIAWITARPLASARRRASRSCALMKVEMMGGKGAKAPRSDMGDTANPAPRSDMGDTANPAPRSDATPPPSRHP